MVGGRLDVVRRRFEAGQEVALRLMQEGKPCGYLGLVWISVRTRSSFWQSWSEATMARWRISLSDDCPWDEGYISNAEEMSFVWESGLFAYRGTKYDLLPFDRPDDEKQALLSRLA